MRFKRKPQSAVIFDHVFAERHWRQRKIGFSRTVGRSREQGRIVLSADAIEPTRGPERIATLKTQRAKSVGVGKALNARWA